jgi:hypothetical protein
VSERIAVTGIEIGRAGRHFPLSEVAYDPQQLIM